MLNLKSEFPRIPLHPNFLAWVNIGAQLITLHAHFEQVTPWGLTRVDDATIVKPKCRLKADKTAGVIIIDEATQLQGIPPQAWQYQLGNRSALEWVLDQYQERTPKDPTIRTHFDTYRLADHKEAVIRLLEGVCRVSVETMQLLQLMATYQW